MKKLYILFLGLGIISSGFAQEQISNGNFETWETVQKDFTSYEAPANWKLEDFCMTAGQTTICEVSGTKTQDSNSGNFALEYTTETGLSHIFSTPLQVSGSYKPISVEAMIKSNLSEGDELSIIVFLHRNHEDLKEAVESDLVGKAEIYTTSTYDSYTKLTGEFGYLTSEPHQFITVKMTVIQGENSTVSTFKIDDLILNYETLTANKSITKNTTISSTVVSDVLIFNQTIEQFEISNISGSVVLQGTSQETNVSSLNQGMYIVKAIKANGELVTYRIIKK